MLLPFSGYQSNKGVAQPLFTVHCHTVDSMSDAMESSSSHEFARPIREAEDNADSNQADGPDVPLHMLLPAGPPPPQPISGSAGSRADTVDGDRPPADNCDASSDEHQWPMLEWHENGEVVSDWVQGPHLPDGRFERSSTESSSVSGSESEEANEAEGGNCSDESWTWSDTTLYLEGEELQEAREYLIGQYRMELLDTDTAQPPMSSRVLGGKVAAMRRKIKTMCWWWVMDVAETSLTGDRQARWRDFQYRATHNRIPRRLKRECVFNLDSD